MVRALLVALATAAGSHAVVLTNASGGHTVHLRKGAVVDVLLTGSASASTDFLWSPPSGGGDELERRSGGRSGVVTRATFKAVHTGATTLTSSEACRPVAVAVACPMVVVLWHVNVDVS